MALDVGAAGLCVSRIPGPVCIQRYRRLFKNLPVVGLAQREEARLRGIENCNPGCLESGGHARTPV